MLHAFRDHSLVTHAFIIDHNLRDGSAVEVQKAAAYARSLGYIVAIDRWEHDGVTTGIQVKARQYRYNALGRLCRAAGLTELLTAHTADDQAETLLMRIERQTGWRGLAGMPVSAYAHLWPALADVTLHRPWLNVSRADLRDYNRVEHIPYIDDPSNENRDFTRVRARQALSVDVDLRTDLLAQQRSARARLSAERDDHARWLSDHTRISEQGFVETDDVPPNELLLHILNGVAGQGGPIDTAKRLRLHEDMARSGFKAATLAGAWVVKTSHGFVFARDMVAVTGRKGQNGLGSIELKQGEKTLWDGRFWVETKRENVHVRAAFGNLQDLRQSADLKDIFNLPKQVRSSLPTYFNMHELIGFGAIDTEFVTAKATTASRLQALYPEAILVSV